MREEGIARLGIHEALYGSVPSTVVMLLSYSHHRRKRTFEKENVSKW
jgi:hypothetical protein